MQLSELKRIEKALGLKLPPPYVKVMREFSKELLSWPESADPNRELFFTDADRIIQVNKRIRSKPSEFVSKPSELRKSWPANLYVFGTWDNRDWYVIDVTQDGFPVGVICGKKFKEHRFYYSVPPRDPPTDGDYGDVLAFYQELQSKHEEIWDEARQAAVVSAKSAPKMSLPSSQFLSEAQALARPAVVLKKTGSSYAAVWRGKGVLPGPRGKWNHWISVALEHVPNIGLKSKLEGVISVYLCTGDSKDFHKVKVVHDPKAKLPRKPDGQMLHAHPISCLPYVDIVFRHGSESIRNWLEANDWKPERGYNSNFPDTPLSRNTRKCSERSTRFTIPEESMPCSEAGASSMTGPSPPMRSWC